MLPLFSARNRAGFLKVTIQKFYRPSGSSTQMKGVASDIVLPSLSDALEVGEEYLENCLPHDRIRPASDFRPLDPAGLFISELRARSQKRVGASKDFSYIIEDVLKAKKRIDENTLSLNKAARGWELTESDAQQKERNAERRTRFEQIAKVDKENLRFFRITLEDLEKGSDLKPYDPADESGDFMRRAKDETEDLDETPKWPTGLDPVKRESLAILRDLVELTEDASVVGNIK
jgi:carboxyl-terminal processing protease